MNYLDLYRKRTFQEGVTPQDRVENRLGRDFSQLIKRSPNRITIEYQNQIFDAVLQSGNARVGTQTERKVVQYLLTPNDKKLPEGTVFTTLSEKDGNRNWIILHREIHPYDGYFKYKVLELNYNLKYVNKGGKVKTIPAYVNSTGEFDIKEYFVFAKPLLLTTPSRAINLVIKANEELDKDTIFLIGDESWRYIDSDKISIPGLYYTTLFKTPTDKENVSIEDQVANIRDIGSLSILNPYLNMVENKIQIAPYIGDAIFYSINNGKLEQNQYDYSIKNKSVVKVENNILIPLNIGKTTVEVSDKYGNIKTFEVEVLRTIPPTIDLIGSTKLKFGFSTNLQIINSYPNVRFELENNLLASLETFETHLKLRAKDELGTVRINAYSNDILIKSFDIEITGWGV